MNVTLAKFTGWKFIDDGWTQFIVDNKNFIVQIYMKVFKYSFGYLKDILNYSAFCAI